MKLIIYLQRVVTATNSNEKSDGLVCNRMKGKEFKAVNIFKKYSELSEGPSTNTERNKKRGSNKIIGLAVVDSPKTMKKSSSNNILKEAQDIWVVCADGYCKVCLRNSHVTSKYPLVNNRSRSISSTTNTNRSPLSEFDGKSSETKLEQRKVRKVSESGILTELQSQPIQAPLSVATAKCMTLRKSPPHRYLDHINQPPFPANNFSSDMNPSGQKMGGHEKQ